MDNEQFKITSPQVFVGHSSHLQGCAYGVGLLPVEVENFPQFGRTLPQSAQAIWLTLQLDCWAVQRGG